MTENTVNNLTELADQFAGKFAEYRQPKRFKRVLSGTENEHKIRR